MVDLDKDVKYVKTVGPNRVQLLNKLNILANEDSRKFIHVGVANWWIVAMIFFNNNIYASIVPALFVIINYIFK